MNVPAALTYKGKPIQRILDLKKKVMNRHLFYVETAETSCVVPGHEIGAEGGVEEVMRVARETRGNVLGR